MVHLIYMKQFLVAISFICLLLTPYASAQVLPQDISISTIPTNPKPGEKITATVESFGMDLMSASITWQYNGTVVAVGTGKTAIVVTAPRSGAVGALSVSATSTEGSASATVLIRPASVDVIWEAVDSYVPPFYKGKALPAVGATLRAVAIPSASAPKTISYSWQHNDDAVQNQSGTNKNSVTIKTDVLSNNESFLVSASGGSFSGGGSTAVTLRSPDVVLYQKSNGFINYAHGSIGDMDIFLPGVTLRAEPFNFTVAQPIEQALSIGFNLDETSFVGTTNALELSITKPEQGGDSSFAVTIRSLKERLQSAKRTFTLHF